MREIFTIDDIRAFSRQGIREIPVDEMPIMTGLAAEELERLGMHIVLKASQAERKPVQPPAIPSRYTKMPFKDYIKQKRALVGTFIGMPHPVMTEYVSGLGYDFLTIDAEHNAMTMETIQQMLQSMRGNKAYGMVRVPAISYEYIAGALDAGADALLIPQVRTMEDIRIIRDAALYPPRGKRGIGPGRAVFYGDDIMSRQPAELRDRDTNIVVQIETLEAVENLDQFLKEDFIDMFFIGPGDLSMAMGVFGRMSDPKLQNAISMVREKTARAGKKLGIFAGNFTAAKQWLDKGFDMVLINSELGMLGETIKKGIKQLEYTE